MKKTINYLAIIALIFSISGCTQSVKNQVSSAYSKAKSYVSSDKKEKKVVKVKKKKKIVQKIPKSILSYAKNKKVFEVDFKTLKKIKQATNIKKNSAEGTLLQLLKDIGIKSSLNLKDINQKYINAKQTKNEIIVLGHWHNSGYVIFFDKITLNINKMYAFRNHNVFDISSDMKKVIIYGTRGKFTKKVQIYDLYSKHYSELKYLKSKPTYLQFSPIDTYIVLFVWKINKKDNTDSLFQIFNMKTKKSVFKKFAFDTKDGYTSFEYLFSPNEKYFMFYKEEDTYAYLYTLPKFNEYLSFSEEKSYGTMNRPDDFVISNKFLIIKGIDKQYNIDTKKLIDTKYIGFASPFISDENDENLFYTIGSDKINIYYIKNDKTHLIKTIPKEKDFSKVALIDNDKLYLFPSYSDSKFQIINISNLGIDKYNFKLVKQLRQAKKFYDAGFKEKSLKIYKKLLKHKDFDKYLEPLYDDTHLVLNTYINLEKYVLTKDDKYLVSYILSALKSNYINEAKKALKELKQLDKKELYTVMNSIYLVQIGKDKKAYNILVDNMPFSNNIKKIIEKNNNSSLKLYKDSSKVSLIFEIDKSKVGYKKPKKAVNFISFDGKLINHKNKSVQKSKVTKTDKKDDAIELLD